METLTNLTSVLFSLIAAGTLTRIICLLIGSAMNPEERKAHLDEIKHVAIVFIISAVIAGGSITAVIYQYLR